MSTTPAVEPSTELPTGIPFTVFPTRYSNDPPALADFFQTLGLSQIIGHPHGQYAVLQAASGRVMLHAIGGSTISPDVGRTGLGFEVADAQKAAQWLEAIGVDATVWDEAYGKHLGIRDHRGGGLWISEEMADLYGYQQIASGEPADIDVTAVYYTTDFVAARSFFGQLGFQSEHPDATGYDPLRAQGRTGVVGLHAIDVDPPLGPPNAGDPMAPACAAIDLGFETGMRLDDLVDRLHSAGYSDARVEQDPLHVTVTDPDGRSVEVFPRG